ncbi:hypothetical protein OH77DRAFT_1056686 [Trametes cingulata]|nr:hypothetical protein OH77DRAFT_1056686 [Trametes cingulata]
MGKEHDVGAGNSDPMQPSSDQLQSASTVPLRGGNVQLDETSRDTLQTTVYSLSPDILRLVCRHLAQNHAFKALSACAQTCRLLSEPALDALWHTVTSLDPLIFTLPPDVLSGTPVLRYRHVSGATYVQLARAVVPEDLSRYCGYAARVHVISSEQVTGDIFGHRTTASQDVWEAIDRAQPPDCFPHVHTVVLADEWPVEPPSPVYAAFGRSLKVARIIPAHYAFKARDEDPISTHIRTIERLSVAARSLQRLAFTYGCDLAQFMIARTDFLERIAPPLAATVAALTQLTVLTVPETPLLPLALRHLSVLPTLEELNVRVRAHDYDWDALPRRCDAKGPIANSFPRLRALELESDCLWWCAQFMRTFSYPSLASFTLLCSRTVDPALFRVFTEALGRTSSPLQAVTLTFGPKWSPMVDQANTRDVPLYTGRTIEPLYALSAMQRLKIEGDCHVSLDDSALSALSRAWPSLLELNFSPSHRAESYLKSRAQAAACATVAGLLALAERCPCLHFLRLEVDLSKLPSGAEHERIFISQLDARRPRSSLHTFLAGYSAVGEPTRAAGVLCTLFPGLRAPLDRGEERKASREEDQLEEDESRVGDARYLRAVRQKWLDVAELVLWFAQIREQEHKWRATHRSSVGELSADVGVVGSDLA